MSDRLLAGSKIIFLCTEELVRADAAATVTIEGWELNGRYPVSESEMRVDLGTEPESVLAVVLEKQPAQCDKFMRLIRECGIDDSQVVVGTISNSLVHRALMRAGVTGFPFSATKTPTGFKFEVSGLVTALQNVWHKRCALQLEREMKNWMENGSLSMMSVGQTNVTSAILKERAHLAFSLANYINYDMTFRLRTIRLSLFADLIRVDNWQSIVSESRKFWPIKDLLDIRAANHNGNIVGTLSWTPNMPLELVIVETVVALQKHKNLSENQFKDFIKNCAKQLPLEARTAITQGVGACLKHVWGIHNDHRSKATG